MTDVQEELAVLRQQIADNLEDTQAALDTSWILQNAFLVFFMQLGFTLFEVGSCPSNLSRSIIYKNMMDMGLVTLGWYCIGYAISGPGNSFAGDKEFASNDIAQMTGLVFGWGFNCATSTIDSGATIGRIRLPAYILQTIIVAWFIYPLAAHWVWSADGWLQTRGFIDFAGTSVVHTVGGMSSLIGSILLGPRNNRWVTTADGERKDNIRPSSIVLTATGTWMLAFGWFGFNSGSTLGVSNGMHGVAALVVVNTFLALGSAILTVMLYCYLVKGSFKVADSCMAMLAGLVTITASAATASTGGSLFAGALGALASLAGSALLVKFEIDDAVDAFPVHGVCGILGTLLVPFISTTKGYTRAGYTTAAGLSFGERLGEQCLGILCVSLLTAVFLGLPMLLMKLTTGIRVTAQEELVGLDYIYHQAGITLEDRVRMAKEQMHREKEIRHMEERKHSQKSSKGDLGRWKRGSKAKSPQQESHKNGSVNMTCRRNDSGTNRDFTFPSAKHHQIDMKPSTSATEPAIDQETESGTL